jgi:hypothetical protein
MAWPPHHVTHVEVAEPYHVVVAFGDGRTQEIDLEPALHGQFLGALRDREAFRRAAIDELSGGLRWENGVTIDAHKLYHWPTEGPPWAATARRLAARERKLFAVQKWLLAGAVVLFGYSLATWAGLTEDQPFRPLNSLLVSGAMVLQLLASLALRRSAKLAWPPLVASVVILGFLMVSMSARR